MSLNNYLLLSGFNIIDENRGTAALGYGSISFLYEKGYIDENTTVVLLKTCRDFWNCGKRCKQERLFIQDKNTTFYTLYVFSLEVKMYILTGIHFPFTRFAKFLKKLKTVAAINGGDGFSDIYSTRIFKSRLTDTLIGMRKKAELVILPQTLGPFAELDNYHLAINILKSAKVVYVRDEQFVPELDKNNINYEKTKDLSAYMKPEPWAIKIAHDSVGINISGLAYYNGFPGLEGQFDAYPELVNKLILHFQSKGKNIYIIPHSYNYKTPEINNDDMEASREVYSRLTDKTGVTLIDKDLISPQIKYVISKMSFFIGTRMHANFAAIYTNVPVFGLAYSYKFVGAFEAHGQSKEQTVMINNILSSDIDNIIQRIDKYYNLTMI